MYTVRYAPYALRVCRFMCKHHARVYRARARTEVRTYIKTRLPARLCEPRDAGGGDAHALCMNACTYTDRAGFIPGGTSGRARR